MTALPLDAYPPLRTQPAEFIGTRVLRGEPCACGGWLTQHAGQPIDHVVKLHNQTPQHITWSRTLDR